MEETSHPDTLSPKTLETSNTHSSQEPKSGDITHLSTARLVLTVALPATASFTLNTFFSFIDAYFVGKLGTEAMAALSSAGILTWVLYSIGSLGEVGAQAFASQAIGAGDTFLLRRSVLASLVLQSLIALLVLIPLFFLTGFIFQAMNLTPDVAQSAQSYLAPFLVGLLFYLPGMVAMAVFHAHGDTRTPALFLGGCLLLNALLDPLFIFGFGPIPRMELFGAGLATAICKILFSFCLIAVLIRRKVLDVSAWKADRLTARIARKVWAIGLPIAVNGAFFSGVYLVLVRILADFGNVPVATLGIVHRIENLGWFACTGFSVAGAAVAGQLMGSGKPNVARRKVWKLTLWLTAILSVVSVFFWFFGGQLTGVFTEDEAVIFEGRRYLRTIAIFEILMGFEVMFEEALSAVGSPKTALAVGTPLTLIRIPLAWLLAHQLGLGVAAVWWVISTTTALKGIFMALGFTFGAWRHTTSFVKFSSEPTPSA